MIIKEIKNCTYCCENHSIINTSKSSNTFLCYNCGYKLYISDYINLINIRSIGNKKYPEINFYKNEFMIFLDKNKPFIKLDNQKIVILENFIKFFMKLKNNPHLCFLL